MKLVIDLDVQNFKDIRQAVSEGIYDYNGTIANLLRSVANGIPLPKRHGRLKDAIEADLIKEADKEIENAISKL